MRKITMLLLVVALSAVPAVADDNLCNLQNVQNVNTACVKYTRKKAEQGDVEAQFILGVIYNYGIRVGRDYGEALRWFRAAAEQGNAKAQYNLGVMYYTGEGVERDYGEALRWFRAAAKQEHAGAQNNLGAMYSYGNGVAPDKREAFNWYRVAAKQGNAQAQNNLGVMYYNGDEVARDYDEALRWYRMAVEQGYAEAQFNLGVMYYNGDGVERDYGEALRWYRMAAEQGYAGAQNILGVMYFDGKGVERDYGEALRWYRRAAEQGHAVAQNNLGVMYSNGEGVAQDKQKAFDWYRMAAEQGSAKAQFNLGLMYEKGTGVVKEEREAYIWFLIAMASGNESAEKLLQMISLQQDLTSVEIKFLKHKASQRFAEIKNRRNSIQNSGISQKYSKEYTFAQPPEDKNIGAEVFKNIWRSVVRIKTDVKNGGGVVIDSNLVATNCHVIEGGSKIVVHKPENQEATEYSLFDAKVFHQDKAHDFCVLEVDGLRAIPATARIYDDLQIGESVYTLGAPYGWAMTISGGVISQLPTIKGLRLIQTDALILMGSSGGGLFDAGGKLIGILTYKLTEDKDMKGIDFAVEGIGFAIPADLTLEF